MRYKFTNQFNFNMGLRFTGQGNAVTFIIPFEMWQEQEIVNVTNLERYINM